MLAKSIFTLVVVSLITAIPAHAVSNKQAKAAFIKADKNSDNALTRSEFETFIRQMAKLGNTNAARAVQFGFVGFRIAFSDADKNGNGLVTAAELQKIR